MEELTKKYAELEKYKFKMKNCTCNKHNITIDNLYRNDIISISDVIKINDEIYYKNIDESTTVNIINCRNVLINCEKIIGLLNIGKCKNLIVKSTKGLHAITTYESYNIKFVLTTNIIPYIKFNHCSFCDIYIDDKIISYLLICNIDCYYLRVKTLKFKEFKLYTTNELRYDTFTFKNKKIIMNNYNAISLYKTTI